MTELNYQKMKINKKDVYYEKCVGNKHCYKYQIPGQKNNYKFS
jgi:hypothetical protein